MVILYMKIWCFCCKQGVVQEKLATQRMLLHLVLQLTVLLPSLQFCSEVLLPCAVLCLTIKYSSLLAGSQAQILCPSNIDIF